MAIKTQGTQLYTIDPADGTVLEVGCVTNIDGIDTTVEQVEITCLSEQVREYMAGLATPGAASFGINFDPRDASHVRLHALKVAGTTLQWAVGFSDGADAPTSDPDTDDGYVFVVDDARSWIVFEGFMNSYPFSFQQNAAVTSTVGIQVSGEPAVIPASAT
jgi:hypothetical protein